MKKRKKRLRQLVLAFLILNMIVLPIQNIVFANEIEQTINEAVLLEETEAKESEAVETNTSDSNNIESETAPISEKESEPTEISSSETVLEKSKVLTDTPTFNSSEKQKFSEEASSTTKQSEKRPVKKVTSGGFPNGSTATWEFDDTTGTLSVSGGTLINPADSIDSLTGIPVSEITNIVFEDKLFLSGSCKYLFGGNRATKLDLSNFDTSNVTDMSFMFINSAATNLDLSSFNTSNVTTMQSMFDSSAVTSLDLSNFNTSKVTSMRYMFDESVISSLDLSNFDTSKVQDMYCMFYQSAATSIDVSNFDTSKVTEMTFMFQGSSVTSLDLSNWDTRSGPEMTQLFYLASSLQNITLGSRFWFKSISVRLFDPPTTAKYTGKWQNVGSGTVDKPKGSFVGTATELMSTYDGSTMADTYVWQPTLLEVNVQDSILMVGDTWNPENNFLDATDSAGDPVDFKDTTVTGSVDTTQPGVYTVNYSYGGITSTATITVLETMPASWVNFFVDGTNVRAIPGSALSTPEWDFTTGLWDKWNPGTVKVPADKLPSEPAKQGYEFKGWEDNAGTIVDFNTVDLDLNSQHEFDFYAAFEKKEYTVIFDVEGTQQQETVPFEDLVTEPTVPYKAGYAFTGWYDSESGGNKWDFSTDKMPAGNVTLYARFNKLGFVTPEIKPSIPTIITPIMPGVDPITPNIEPPTIPGEGPNTVAPPTPSNGSGSNTVSNTGSRNTIITSPKNTTTFSLATSQESKLAKLGEKNSLILLGLGLIMMISGIVFFIFKRKKSCS
ncbi:TPA: BspA family leucine-rich repeat surface protein [Listeria monocytogenes]|nr:BspA family leucine-rich repeat surface protein [Listeria monocytogenes]HAO6009622.1 BspA family leucine-rich repeat surface protein [Listeria monocytogenes]